MIERTRIILTAAVTWLTVAGAVATILVDELADVPTAANIAARAAVIIGTSIAIIRRVTPVLPDDRSIITKEA